MTLENEKRFLLLLSSYFIGEGATKADVLNKIIENDWIILSDKDQEVKDNRNELVWRNDLAFVRKHLEQKGFFVSNIRNDWSITEDGIKELKKLSINVKSEEDLVKISKQAKSFLMSNFDKILSI